MTVRIRNLQGGAGVGGAVTFSDTMNRTTGPLGENWCAGLQCPEGIPGGQPSMAEPMVGIAASSVDGSQVMKIFTNNPAAIGSVSSLCIMNILPVGLLGRSQFCQWTVKRHLRVAGVNNLFAGPTVLMTCSSKEAESNCYILQLATPGASMALIRRNGAAETGLVGGLTFADNDVLRIEAVINPANVTLTVRKNGTIQAGFPVVDAAAGRLTTGLPGWMATSMNEASVNYVSEWINYSCGPA